MATINSKKKVIRRKLNHEGADVYSMSSLEAIFSKVLGSFFGESTNYENRDPETAYRELEELISKVKDKDKEYVLKIAILGRMSNMISYPLNILAVCSNDPRFKGDNFTRFDGTSAIRYYYNNIVRRALDVTEILAVQKSLYNRPIPSIMKRCLREKLESFDTFKLSKGLAKGHSVSLKDAICILRPKPANDTMAKVYKDIIEGTLKVGAGKTQIKSALSQKEGLEEAVNHATIQNIVYGLVGIIDSGSMTNDIKDTIVSKLTNKKLILESKLLPFRFLSAYNEVIKYREEAISEALITALEYSIENLKNLEGETAILVDESGSMDYPVSKMSSTTARDISNLLGAITFKKSNGDIFVFGNECKKFRGSRRDSVMSLANQMRQYQVGCGTNIEKAINTIAEYADRFNIKYDNLIIISDNDCYSCANGDFRIGERNFWSVDNYSADKQVNNYMREGVFKQVWLNNLLGNDFAIVNTKSNRKNLVTGFSEKFIDIIHTYKKLKSGDIKKVIDEMLEEAKGEHNGNLY